MAKPKSKQQPRTKPASDRPIVISRAGIVKWNGASVGTCMPPQSKASKSWTFTPTATGQVTAITAHGRRSLVDIVSRYLAATHGANVTI
jgi:hypothetical protein